MKKWIALMLAAVMLLALVACGAKQETAAPAQQEAPSEAAPAQQEAAAPAEPAPAAEAVQPAESGTLKIGVGSAAVTFKGTAVPMPYRFADLQAAGVPVDEASKDISLGAGDTFSLNLYLDADEQYLLIPAYSNNSDSAVTVAEAKAGEITLSTYASEPKDQDASILGVKFGMTKSEVKALLGEPASEDGEYLQWAVEVTDAEYEGSFSLYFTSGADDAAVSQITLSLTAKI